MTREKVWHYPEFVRLSRTSTLLRSVELGMRKESRVISHFHTPKRSVELRTKKESRDLVASAGHLCLLSAALLNKLRGVYSCKIWYIRAASMFFNRSTGFKTWAMRGKAHTRLLHQNGGILRGTGQRGAPKNDIHQVLWRQRSWASVRSSFADSGLFY